MKKNAKLKKKITKYRPETQDDIFTMPYNYFYTNIFILKIEKKSTELIYTLLYLIYSDV